MKIFTGEIKRYKKLILSSEHRGSSYGEYLFLDFEDQYIYINTDTFFGKISFRFDLRDDTELYENFYINIRAFMALCDQYDELTLDSDIDNGHCIFYADEERFELPIIKGDYDSSHFQYDGLPSYEFSVDHIKKIKEASKFTGVNDPHRNLAGIGLNEDKLVASDTKRLYIGTLSDKFPQCSLSEEAITMFVMVAGDYPVNLIIDNSRTFDDDDEIESSGKLYFDFGHGEAIIGIPRNTSVAVPDLVNDHNFKQRLEIDTSIVIEKQELFDILKFFESFVKLELNQRLYLSITSDDSLSIEARDEIKGNRILPIKECSDEIIERGFYFSRDNMIPVISSIHDDFIRIKISDDEDVPVFIVTGEEDESVIIAISMFEDINNEENA